MDRADEIIDELMLVAGSLPVRAGSDETIPAALDYRYALDGSDDELPMVVVRTGGEEAAPLESARQVLFDRRWRMTPTIEIMLDLPPSQQRGEVARLWAAFRERLAQSRILELIAHNTMPEISRTVHMPGEDQDLVAIQIELGLTFERV